MEQKGAESKVTVALFVFLFLFFLALTGAECQEPTDDLSLSVIKRESERRKKERKKARWRHAENETDGYVRR